MGYVFISYAHADAEEVERIVSKLEASGIEVWIDRDSIRGGRQWRREIVEGIDNAGAFVLHLSSSAAASINVLKELNLAEEATDPFIIPLLLQNIKIPSQMRYQLAGLQYVAYFENAETGYQMLESQVLERLGQATQLTEQCPADREIELVIKDGSIEKFTETERVKLLQDLASIAKGEVGDFAITRVVVGSLHVFVRMPIDNAYELQAQALNCDPRLLAAGISAIRFKLRGGYIVDGKFSTTPEIESSTSLPAAVPTKKPWFWWFTKTVIKTVFYLVVFALTIFGLLCFSNALFPQLNLPSLDFLAPVATPTVLAAQPEPTATPPPSPTLTLTITQVPDTATPTATSTPSPTVTASTTLTPSSTSTASPSPTMTPSPTEDNLLATSNSQAFCRYGPSTAYLSYADIFVGDQVAVQGRYQYGGWVWVRPVDRPASCWMAASLLDPPLELNELPIIDYRISMIFSQDVDPPGNVTAVRNVSTVTISWDPINVSPADFRGYLLDAYVCQNGSYLKYIDDIQNTSVVITDELNTCPAGSSGKIYGVHTRGYTDPVTIPWP